MLSSAFFITVKIPKTWSYNNRLVRWIIIVNLLYGKLCKHNFFFYFDIYLVTKYICGLFSNIHVYKISFPMYLHLPVYK